MNTDNETHHLPAVADSIGKARAIVAEAAGTLPQPVRDDAVLLVSELMSNAVRHGGDAARLTVVAKPHGLTISVHDNGSDLPVLGDLLPAPSMTSGRGLRIVERVADRWGTDLDPDGQGKTVWFELCTTPSGAPSDAHETKSQPESEEPSGWN